MFWATAVAGEGKAPALGGKNAFFKVKFTKNSRNFHSFLFKEQIKYQNYDSVRFLENGCYLSFPSQLPVDNW